MPTKGSREQDEIVHRAEREMRGIEHERLNVNPAGPDTHASGSIGGGDKAGRAGKIHSGTDGQTKNNRVRGG